MNNVLKWWSTFILMHSSLKRYDYMLFLFGKCMWGLITFIVVVNCFTRFAVLHTSASNQILSLSIAGSIFLLLPIYKNNWLKPVIFVFAFFFPLFGSLPYSQHSFLFDLFLNVLCMTLLVHFFRNSIDDHKKTYLSLLLIFFFLLSGLSLLQLPVEEILWKLFHWDWTVLWSAVFFATPELPLYSFAAFVRGVLFCFFIILISCHGQAKGIYHIIFIGVLSGALWSSFVGICEFYNLVDLNWFRNTSGRGLRLQSVFANSGWFAEYLAVTIPYVLLGFISPKLKSAHKICLFGLLIVSEIALILTYSRTGWLLYPLVLLVCWIFFYIATQAHQGKISWTQIYRVILKVMVSIPITIIVSYILIFIVFDSVKSVDVTVEKKFEKRIKKLTTPISRKVIWNETFMLIKEKPFFGFGYESFKYHNKLQKNRSKQWDTPHNFYLQLLVSGGIAGLSLWGLLIFASIYLLIADLVKNKAYFNIAVIISMVAFHIYGLAQSMQYIPMIWLLIFLNIGYAMTINENLFPQWVHRKRYFLVSLLVIVVFAGLISYSNILGFIDNTLEEDRIKANHNRQEDIKYLGFYSPEIWGERGIYRWTGSAAVIKPLPAEFLEFTYVCSAPDLSTNPVFLSVYQDTKKIDEIAFYQAQSLTKQYYFKNALIDKKGIYFSVSRTWNLKKLGVANDSRSLGIAISDPKTLPAMPIEGIGFFHWEKWQGQLRPGPYNNEFDFRWTGQEAIFNPSQLNESGILYIKAEQPELKERPLLVQFWQNNKLVQKIEIENNEWQSVNLQQIIDKRYPCVIKVARTWNPRKSGLGEDSRTLGVAVAGIIKEKV